MTKSALPLPKAAGSAEYTLYPSSITNNNWYELESQFTKDQIIWLEDRLTSTMLHVAFVEKELNKVKNYLSEALKDVKQHSGEGIDKP